MKGLFILSLLISGPALAYNEAFYEQVQRDFPEAIEIKESYSPNQISNANKRVPQSTKSVSINQEVLLTKMMEKMNSQEKEIENLKKTISGK